VDLRPKPGQFTVTDDVWESQSDGSQRRVYRAGQRISLTQAVAAGLAAHPETPVSEPHTATAPKDEPKPAKKRQPRTAAGKARKKGTVQDKARKRTEDKRGS
jgi:hypothetical protein